MLTKRPALMFALRRNPFGFSLTAKQAGGDFYINYKDVDTALLTLPVVDAVRAETSTGQDAALVLDFKEKRILQSLDNTAFGVFFNDITNTAGVTFNLHGGANGLSPRLLFAELS